MELNENTTFPESRLSDLYYFRQGNRAETDLALIYKEIKLLVNMAKNHQYVYLDPQGVFCVVDRSEEIPDTEWFIQFGNDGYNRIGVIINEREVFVR